MAVTLTRSEPRAVSLSATPNLATRVDLPSDARGIVVSNVASGTLLLAYVGTDGATIDSSAIRLSASSSYIFPRMGKSSVYIASTSASLTVSVRAIFDEV